MNEESVIFGGHGGLVGILTTPAGEARAGLVFPNAGLVPAFGPGRLFVDLARALAKEGIASLRFDHSGIGESPRRDDERSFLDLHIAEVAEALDELTDRGIERLGVFGLCSGAYAARQTLNNRHLDFVFLVNPQNLVPGSDLAAESWKKRYLTQSVFRPQAWKNLLTGKVNTSRLIKVFTGKGSEPTAADEYKEDVDEVRQQLHESSSRGCRVVFILSGRDPSVDEVSAFLKADLRAVSPEGPLEAYLLDEADHLFLAPADKAALVRAVEQVVA